MSALVRGERILFACSEADMQPYPAGRGSQTTRHHHRQQFNTASPGSSVDVEACCHLTALICVRELQGKQIRGDCCCRS